MGRHLNMDRWYDKMPTTGKLRMKRVSAKMEEQFSRGWRDLLRTDGPAKTVKELMACHRIGLAEAWAMLKHMVND